MRNAINALRPTIARLRMELNDRELWCLCIIGTLVVLAS